MLISTNHDEDYWYYDAIENAIEMLSQVHLNPCADLQEQGWEIPKTIELLKEVLVELNKEYK
tara:strand:+ start:672 stop:857 length:186 start_codon:yes stop_codon:yes gene_type:complete